MTADFSTLPITIAPSRRQVLKGLAAAAVSLGMGTTLAVRAATPVRSPNGKSLAGVFPIGWTPCTPTNKINLDAMAEQMKFLNRGRVAGIAWPQNASGWETLSEQEWHDGADALTSVRGTGAVVLGVQSLGFNIATSLGYARAAKAKGADAIISLVPTGASDEQAIAYFKALADAASLPLFIQAVGNVSVDTLVALSEALPSFVAVKDEAGDPLERAASLLARTHGRLEDFSGAGGHTFFAEMELGFLGTCPYAGLADVLQHSFELYQAGNKREAFDAFGRFLAFDSLPHANEYVMQARGVFPEETSVRSNPPKPGAPAAGPRHQGPITEAQRSEIRLALHSYLKPYLIA